jgi:energy-coupling factor transporter ATP-binding protein EcfA2
MKEVGMLKAIRFRVQNFRNIDDSGWIPLEGVTVFVGRNESGKTALLKALHKFNPATPVPYDSQREFPRDRYTHDYENGVDWPVCSVAFEIGESLRKEMEAVLDGAPPPQEAICTRFYDGSLQIQFEPAVQITPIRSKPLVAALTTFASGARRLTAPAPEQEDQTQKLRTDLATWASTWQEKLKTHVDLRSQDGITLLSNLRKESDKYANPQTADLLEALQSTVDPALEEAKKTPADEQIAALMEAQLPVFIYFDDYGVLDSAIYLPNFLRDLDSTPDDPCIRTINAMFKHVRLSAKEIADLGKERAQQAQIQKQQPTAEMIAQDQQQKEARAIKLNSASLDITNRFNGWYGQRRHTIDYQADGDYFRIWVADDRRPGVKIELECRSKGFQWFFSFYLIFLVESEEGHKDAILLLDEPGLHLHPTAQQELISFFEKLAEANQLIYTTHSPFLIDGENIHRVRPVTEDEFGHSHVSVEGWPKDRETIFPLQAAAGYAMVRGLFQHKQNVLVEGMSDYYYLYALSHQCGNTKRVSLPEDIYITPCGGTKMVSQIASLFLGQEVRPIVLLDGDDAGRVRRDALMKELYTAHGSAILMLDEAVGRKGEHVEIEDIFGEDIILEAVKNLIKKSLKLNETDRKKGSLPTQIKSAAGRQSIELPDGWKVSVAIQIVSDLAGAKIELPSSVLDVASGLFSSIRERFGVQT